MNTPTEEELHDMSYLDICRTIHEIRRTGNIDTLDMFAVELAAKLDHFRFAYSKEKKKCVEYLESVNELKFTISELE